MAAFVLPLGVDGMVETEDISSRTDSADFFAWLFYQASAAGCEANVIRRQEEESPIWEPQAGPQTAAFNSPADIIGYGGSAGGGKSQLALGLAVMKHRRSIMFRRIFKSLSGIIDDSEKILTRNRPGYRDEYNKSLHIWKTADKRTIEFAQIQHEADKKKYQGIPRDLMVFDEATEFPESVVRFLMGWNRTTVPGQPCKVVLTFNPPMDDTGDWVTDFFGPWLNPEHPEPATYGELRWYARVNDQDYAVDEKMLRWFVAEGDNLKEVADDRPVQQGKHLMQPMRGTYVDGTAYLTKSRTFFKASLKDNPILAATGYGATIDALPEPLRSLLKGQFEAGRVADPWQVIPGDWVRMANKRWEALAEQSRELGFEMPGALRCDCIGADIARGGSAKTVLAKRYGTWFAPLIKAPGRSTPNGPAAAAFLMNYWEEGAVVHLDAIGVGSSPFDILEDNGIPVVAVIASERSNQMTKLFKGDTDTEKPKQGKKKQQGGRLPFRNVRAEMWWRLREALDPVNGDDLALPPDPELLADLCAPRWSLSTAGILIESKEDVAERIGRSTDSGDAVVEAHWMPPKPPELLWA